MKWHWRFAGLKTAKGNVLKDFLSGDVTFQAKVDAFLLRLQTMPIPWPASYFDGGLGDGVGELRIDHMNVEYRFYGFFGPGRQRFTVMIASGDKKGQQATIAEARKMKRAFDQVGISAQDVEDYDV